MTFFQRLVCLMAGGFIVTGIALWGILLFGLCVVAMGAVAGISSAGKRKEIR